MSRSYRAVLLLSIALIIPVALIAVQQHLRKTCQQESGGNGMPSGWDGARVPDSLLLMCANYSQREWRVERSPNLRIVDATQSPTTPVALPPEFVRTKEMPGTPLLQQISNGWLVGFDGGEWGGSLWWSDQSGRTKRRLGTENVHAFVRRGNEVLVFTGLAHLSIDEGRVYAYKPDSGELTLVSDLGSAPGAATPSTNSSVLVVTHSHVLRLNSDNGIETLYAGTEQFGWLYPNSIVDDPDLGIMLGMRFYVLRLRPIGRGRYEPLWYVQAGCNKVKQQDYDCKCVGGG